MVEDEVREERVRKFTPIGLLCFPVVSGKEPACLAGDVGSTPGSGRSPRGRHGNPLQYFLPEKSHGQRSLVGYSPWESRRVGHN